MKQVWIVAMLAAIALAGCATEEIKDTDGDGLIDQLEKGGWIVTTYTMTGRLIYTATSDPNLLDSDGDGLSDHLEFLQIPATDPSNPDTDGDGLTDCQEALHTNVTECLDPLFIDHDGGYPTEATWADSDPGVNIYVNDHLGYVNENGEPLQVQRGDGISDGDEILGYEVTWNGRTEIITSDPLDADSDDDWLGDGSEIHFGSHPKVIDSDGDGCLDGIDALPTELTTYHATEGTFTLAQGEPETKLQFLFNHHGEFLEFPREGTISVSGGETVGLPDIAFKVDCEAYLAKDTAPFTPWLPWITLEVAITIQDEQSATLMSLDEEQSIRWNVQKKFIEGKAPETPLIWTPHGAKGTMQFTLSLS